MYRSKIETYDSVADIYGTRKSLVSCARSPQPLYTTVTVRTYFLLLRVFLPPVFLRRVTRVSGTPERESRSEPRESECISLAGLFFDVPARVRVLVD